jgi:hypothetical protein
MKNKFNVENKQKQSAVKIKVVPAEADNSILATSTSTTTMTSTITESLESSTTTSTTTTSTTTTTTTTSETITSCENGGLFIDNICICLNQFTGKRCEIAPEFEDTTESNTEVLESSETTESVSTATKIATSSPCTPHSTNDNGRHEQVNLEDGLIPVFTFNRLSRFKSNESSLIEPRNIYWPWFGNKKISKKKRFLCKKTIFIFDFLF